MANTLPSQCEGFVVTDSQGRRIKIKTREYLRAHADLCGLNRNIWFHVISSFVFDDVPTFLSPRTWQDLVHRHTTHSSSDVARFYEATLKELGCTKNDLRSSSSLRKEFERRCLRPPPLAPPKTVKRAATMTFLIPPAKARRVVSLPAKLSCKNMIKDILNPSAHYHAPCESTLADCIRDFDVVIMRGLPGSGKSTLVKRTAQLLDVDFLVASADAYFSRSGVYKFCSERLRAAHQSAQFFAENAMRAGRKVIIDNTNLSKREVDVYVSIAARNAAKVCVFEIPRPCTLSEALELKNIHDVPPGEARRIVKRPAGS